MAKKVPVQMDQKDYFMEHRHLIDLLLNTAKHLEAEAMAQSKEAEDMKKKLSRSKKTKK